MSVSTMLEIVRRINVYLPPLLTSLLTSEHQTFPSVGWTTYPEDLDYGFWAADNGEGQLRPRKAGFRRAVPIMITTPESRGHETIFQADWKFYFWNVIEGGFQKVNASQDLKTVIELLVTKGDRGLKLKEIRQW